MYVYICVCVCVLNMVLYKIILYYDSVLHIIIRMAEDKHLTEAAARNLSPGQLLSLFKMEPKTLGVSRMFALE